MKITLLWPLNIKYSPSLSLLYQAKLLETSFEVDVIYTNLLFSKDLLSTPKEFEENPQTALNYVVKKVENTCPDAVFVGSWSEHMPFVFEFCKKFKNRNPDTTIIVGGHNPTFLPQEVLQAENSIDYVIRGEAEGSLDELLKALLFKKNINHVEGVSFMQENGNIVHTQGRSFVENLDELPLIDFENVLGHKVPERIDLRTQRGCWGTCSFCSLPNMFGKQRYHSSEHVMKQLKHLRDLYDFEYFHLLDENFLSNITRSKKLAQNIGTRFPDLEWGGMFRADVVSQNVMGCLSHNNFIRAAVGLESNNPNILKYLNKTPVVESYIGRIPRIIKILSENLRSLEFGMIVGTPVEQKEDLDSVLKFIIETKQKHSSDFESFVVALGRLIVHPGTKIYGDYLAGNIELFKNETESETILEKELIANYSGLPWAVPWHYYVRNFNFPSKDEQLKALNEVISKAHDFRCGGVMDA